MTYRSSLIVLAAAMVALTGMAAASPLGALNALAKADSAQITEGIAYGPGPRQKLDVYRPKGASPASGFPVVVFFYGGSWNRGERADYAFVGRALASRGLLAVVADYRLYPEVRYPDFLTDCAQALAYTLDKAAALGGNPRQVFVMGHSAGGYNAAMLAFDARWLDATGHAPRELAGFIGLAGPYDFLPMTNPETRPVFFHPHYPAGSQPIDYVSSASPPSFIGAASSDSLIDPQRNSVGLATRLQAAQVPVTLKLYDGLNHMTLAGALAWPLRWMGPVLDDVAGFVEATLRETPLRQSTSLQRSGS